MKKRIFLLLLCLALLLTGCAASRRTPKQTFRIYGLSGAPGGDAISAVDVDWSERKSLTVDQQAQAALEQLLGACTEPGYRTPIPQGVTLLPNTSGARNAEEAVRIARLAREVCHTDFVKVEIEHETKYLLPDNAETIRATEMLAKEGFVVMPYMFPDPIAARQLEEAGAAAVMPLGSLIGSNMGLRMRDFIEIIIANAHVPVIIDAGIGRPSQACDAMEMGADAVMAYTAVASAGNIPLMAEAFKHAIDAGRAAYLSGLGKVTEGQAVPSSPTTGYLH